MDFQSTGNPIVVAISIVAPIADITATAICGLNTDARIPTSSEHADGQHLNADDSAARLLWCEREDEVALHHEEERSHRTKHYQKYERQLVPGGGGEHEPGHHCAT